MMPSDMPIKYLPEFLVITEQYFNASANRQTFNHDFSIAWTKMMNADRFDGPTKSVC